MACAIIMNRYLNASDYIGLPKQDGDGKHVSRGLAIACFMIIHEYLQTELLL